jgi:hypothetical protein
MPTLAGPDRGAQLPDACHAASPLHASTAMEAAEDEFKGVIVVVFGGVQSAGASAAGSGACWCVEKSTSQEDVADTLGCQAPQWYTKCGSRQVNSSSSRLGSWVTILQEPKNRPGGKCSSMQHAACSRLYKSHRTVHGIHGTCMYVHVVHQLGLLYWFV